MPRRHARIAIPMLVLLSLLAGACGTGPATPPTIPAGSASPGASSPAASSIPSAAATQGPVATATSSPVPTATATPGTALLEALSYLGRAPDAVTFMDWDAVREAAGAAALTGAATFEEKVRALGVEPTLSGEWLSAIKGFRDDWGFDAFDLAWEARAASAAGIVAVLRFRDASGVPAVVARLDALGFEREALAFGTLRSTTLAALSRVARPIPALLNTGILADGRTLVVSASPDLVRAVLADGPQPVPGGGLLAVAERLASPSVAQIATGDPCTVITQALLAAKLEGDGPSVADQLAAAGPLGHPEAIGVAYARADGPTGRVVLAYADAAGAAADLEGRTSLARSGSGLLNPLAEVFAVAAASVDGPAIVLDVAPPAGAAPDSSAVKGFPRRVIDMAIRRDMIYAACTP